MIKKNKFILLLFILLLIISNVFATTIETETYQGVSVEENNVYENVNIMSAESLELQETSAEDNQNQIGVKLVTVEERKQMVTERISILWGYIIGLFIIIFDILKSLMYIIEVYLMFLILFKMFPFMLIKIKNSITKWYLEKI